MPLVRKTRIIECTERIRQNTQVWNEALRNCRGCLNRHPKEYNKVASPLRFTESYVLSLQFSTTKSVIE